MTITEQRVALGIKYLDRELAAGWRNKISLDRLNLAIGNDCVFGQLYGWYSSGQDRLGLSDGQAYDLGFTNFEPDNGANVGDYSELTAEWVRQLPMPRPLVTKSIEPVGWKQAALDALDEEINEHQKAINELLITKQKVSNL